MSNSTDWTQQTYSLSWLRKLAHDHAHLTSAVDFLVAIGVAPSRESFAYRGVPFTNRNPVVVLNATALKARYLAEVANDWDAEGESTPVEFIDALACEVGGTSQRDVVSEVLMSLGSPDLFEAVLEDVEEELSIAA